MVIEHVVKSTICSEWTLYDQIDNFDDFKDLIAAFQEAQEGDGIMLKLNCPGGRVDVGMMIVQAMQESKATIVCNVVAPCYSMGSLIAIAGDYTVMKKHTFLMFHTYFAGYGGKSGDMIKQLAYDDEYTKAVMHDICTPFLTKRELNILHKGDDLYIKADDPTMPARLKRHYKDVVLDQ